MQLKGDQADLVGRAIVVTGALAYVFGPEAVAVISHLISGESPNEDRVDQPAPDSSSDQGQVDPQQPPQAQDGDKPGGPTVYRYVGSGEAEKAEKDGFIPNTDPEGNPKDVYVTPDKHETSDSAQEALQIGQNDPRGPRPIPTHRIEGDATGVKFDQAGNVDGPAGTETGTELTTREQIPVRKVEKLPTAEEMERLKQLQR